jgi:hypothetical protein
MELIIKGVIKRITAPQEWPSGFKKCTIHVETTGDKYPEVIPIDFVKDDVDEALTLAPGQKIKCNCNVKGKEWRREETDPYTVFLSLSMWKYEVIEESIKEQVVTKAKANPGDDADDLPF